MWEKGVNKRGMRLEQMQTILDQQLFGYSVTKVFWEDKVEWDGKQWLGDVKTKLWHPAEFWASDDERIDDGRLLLGIISLTNSFAWECSRRCQLTSYALERTSARCISKFIGLIGEFFFKVWE